jgi:hypothetical protein
MYTALNGQSLSHSSLGIQGAVGRLVLVFSLGFLAFQVAVCGYGSVSSVVTVVANLFLLALLHIEALF